MWYLKYTIKYFFEEVFENQILQSIFIGFGINLAKTGSFLILQRSSFQRICFAGIFSPIQDQKEAYLGRKKSEKHYVNKFRIFCSLKGNFSPFLGGFASKMRIFQIRFYCVQNSPKWYLKYPIKYFWEMYWQYCFNHDFCIENQYFNIFYLKSLMVCIETKAKFNNASKASLRSSV